MDISGGNPYSQMVNGKPKPIRKEGSRTKQDARIAAVEIETKELGISYPTVRGKLDDIVTSLGYSNSRKVKTDRNKVIHAGKRRNYRRRSYHNFNWGGNLNE